MPTGRTGGPEDELASEPELAPVDVRRRAGVGAVAVTARGVAINLLALGGGIVLARLLLPRDFGLVAVGATLVMLGMFFSDAGIGAALIRRAMEPSRAELRSVLGFQLAATIAVAGVASAATAPFGTVGRVTAVMSLALPLAALRTPALIVLERRLSYRPLALAEVSGAAAYYGWAIVTVLAGWGVWGLATAVVVQAATTSGLMIAVAPRRTLRPHIKTKIIRELIGFGLRYQAVGALVVGRDQALNLGTASLAGVSVLGLWSVARRLLEPSFLLFASLWRVSYPAMARLIAAGEDVRPVVERAVGRVTVGSGVLVVPLVGSAPALVPTLLGQAWEEAAVVLPWAGLALMISGPVSVAATGYLWASGDASTPLRAAAADALAWCAVSLPLLPVAGVGALGVGWLAGATAQATVFERALRRHLRARVAPSLLIPTAIAAAAAGAGWIVSSSGDPGAVNAVGGGSLALGLYLAGLFVFQRALLADTRSVAADMLRASFSDLRG